MFPQSSIPSYYSIPNHNKMELSTVYLDLVWNQTNIHLVMIRTNVQSWQSHVLCCAIVIKYFFLEMLSNCTTWEGVHYNQTNDSPRDIGNVKDQSMYRTSIGNQPPLLFDWSKAGNLKLLIVRMNGRVSCSKPKRLVCLSYSNFSGILYCNEVAGSQTKSSVMIRQTRRQDLKICYCRGVPW